MTYDDNYPQAFAAIRDKMTRMKEVALKYKAVDEGRAKELHANGRSTLFDILNEQGQVLTDEFRIIQVAMNAQIGHYDNQVADRKVAHSQAWHDLLEERSNYFSISTLLLTL